MTLTNDSLAVAPVGEGKEVPPSQQARFEIKRDAGFLDPDELTLLAQKVADLLRSLPGSGSKGQVSRFARE